MRSWKARLLIVCETLEKKVRNSSSLIMCSDEAEGLKSEKILPSSSSLRFEPPNFDAND